jgi:hypothetical protein
MFCVLLRDVIQNVSRLKKFGRVSKASLEIMKSKSTRECMKDSDERSSIDEHSSLTNRTCSEYSNSVWPANVDGQRMFHEFE